MKNYIIIFLISLLFVSPDLFAEQDEYSDEELKTLVDTAKNIRAKVDEYICAAIRLDKKSEKLEGKKRLEPFATYADQSLAKQMQIPEDSDEARSFQFSAEACKEKYPHSTMLHGRLEESADFVADQIFSKLHGNAYGNMIKEIVDLSINATTLVFSEKPDIIWSAVDILLTRLKELMGNELKVQETKFQSGKWAYAIWFWEASQYWVTVGGWTILGGVTLKSGSASLRYLYGRDLWFKNSNFRGFSRRTWERFFKPKPAAAAPPANPPQPLVPLIQPASGPLVPANPSSSFLIPRALNQLGNITIGVGATTVGMASAYGIYEAIYTGLHETNRFDPLEHFLAPRQKGLLTRYYNAYAYGFLPDARETRDSLASLALNERTEAELQKFYQLWISAAEDVQLLEKLTNSLLAKANQHGAYDRLHGNVLNEGANEIELVKEGKKLIAEILGATRAAFKKKAWIPMTPTEALAKAAENKKNAEMKIGEEKSLNVQSPPWPIPHEWQEMLEENKKESDMPTTEEKRGAAQAALNVQPKNVPTASTAANSLSITPAPVQRAPFPEKVVAAPSIAPKSKEEAELDAAVELEMQRLEQLEETKSAAAASITTNQNALELAAEKAGESPAPAPKILAPGIPAKSPDDIAEAKKDAEEYEKAWWDEAKTEEWQKSYEQSRKETLDEQSRAIPSKPGWSWQKKVATPEKPKGRLDWLRNLIPSKD